MSASVKSYRDLIVWQRAIELSVAICGLTDEFPRNELYGLTMQLRRASVSPELCIA
jgi:four helix bundle protein